MGILSLGWARPGVAAGASGGALTGIPEERVTSPAYTPPVTGSSLIAILNGDLILA